MSHYKNLTWILPVALALFVACTDKDNDGIQSGDQTVSFDPDLTSLIRNPASGWTLYDDANDYVSNAKTYWSQQDAAAEKYASIFYWRSRWSELEPEEGKYAWEHDENFKALIQGALDRGLKLAFRVYVDGQDNIYNGTPRLCKRSRSSGVCGASVVGSGRREQQLDPLCR